MPEEVVRAFAPATVANVGSGFDVLGFALEGPGDTVEARRRGGPGVVIADVTGDGGALPWEAGKNTAGIAVRRLLEEARVDAGIELKVAKGMPLASGLGSSAASGVAAVVAANALLPERQPLEVLLRCAVEGERAASGSAHADNAAPSLYGGFVLVRGGGHARVDRIPVPSELHCAIVHPRVEIRTADARAVLPREVPLEQAVKQWGNVAALVAGLFSADWELIASGLEDVIVEPRRAKRVPGFAAAKVAAKEAGALGCGLSGSGPSIFALCRGRSSAARVTVAMADAVKREGGVDVEVMVSVVGGPAARVLDGAVA